MSAMIDTHILILGCHSPRSKDSPQLRARIAAAAALLHSLGEIRMCAVAWFEFQRALRDDERPFFDRIRAKLRIEPVDAAVADRAVSLFNARRNRPAICRDCLGTKDGHACKGCDNRVCNTQRINDAIIVAAAELHEDVSVLYSDDAGVHDFARDVDAARCTVRRPPNPNGPLYEHAAESARG